VLLAERLGQQQELLASIAKQEKLMAKRLARLKSTQKRLKNSITGTKKAAGKSKSGEKISQKIR